MLNIYIDRGEKLLQAVTVEQESLEIKGSGIHVQTGCLLKWQRRRDRIQLLRDEWGGEGAAWVVGHVWVRCRSG